RKSGGLDMIQLWPRPRTLILGMVAALALLSAGGAVFAAANTGTGLTGVAGSGSGVVSGYDISASAYTLDAADPHKTSTIVLTYSGAPIPSRIRISPTGASGTFYYTENAAPAGNACTADATTITCITTAAGGGHQGTVLEL